MTGGFRREEHIKRVREWRRKMMESIMADGMEGLEAAATDEKGGTLLPEAWLRVAEALLEDVDTGTVRMDPADLARIGVLPGDTVLVTGRRSTVARAQPRPSFSSDRHLIQMDGTLRENAQAGLDEKVKVRRVGVRSAETVLLAPTEAVSHGPRELSRVRELLSGLPVTTGDRVKAILYGRRGHFFKVASTAPEGPVLIGPRTPTSA